MRGAKSIHQSNNALYVIDGVPMYNSNFGNNVDNEIFSRQPGSEGAADINPDDIENITLLTGPSAAALYGSEGANGVVLITTKKGRADKTTVTVSNNTTFSTPFIMPKFQNSYGNLPGEVMSWGNKTDYEYDPANFFNTGSNISNTVSLATGSDKSQSYLSASTSNSKGILPNNEYNRYNFSYRNTTSFLDDKFLLDASANYIVQDNKNMISQGQYFNPLAALYLFPRGEDFGEVQLYERFDELSGVNTQFWPYGDQGISIQNPYWIMNRMNRESSKKRYKLSASLQYNVADWINLTGRVNIDNSDYRNTEKRYAGTLATFAGTKGWYSLGDRSERQTYADVLANINKTFGDFTLSANVGASIKDMRIDSHTTSGDLEKLTNFFSTENIDRYTQFKLDDDGLMQQTQSIFASAEVGYNHYLYLTLTARNDWDSALAFTESNDKSFLYPSVGLAAVVSDMVKLPDWFTFLKARLSFTSVGSSYAPYLTREIYEYDEQTNEYNTLALYPNRYLKPELTNSYEAGLNMRFLKGSINLDVTYYHSNTLHQTFVASLPSGAGYSGVYVQAGDVQNSGIELALGYNNKWGDFSWASNLTYTYNKNVVKKLVDGITNPVTGEPIQMTQIERATLGSTGSPVVILTEGGTMGDIYVNREFKRDGNGYIYLDPKTSLPSMISNTEYQKVGSLLPKTNAGWKNSFSYKGVRLNVLLSGRFGGLVVSNTQALLDRYGVSEYSANLRESGNIIINGKEIAAQDYLNIVAAGTGQGAYYVYKATNVRLQEASVEYTLPKKYLPGQIADITVGVVGNNLAMLYCKAPFDPELVASASNTYYTGVDHFMLPSLRNIGFSVKLQF
jgi:TonB-linked SusC/RagA family outer membrane protein